MEFNKVSIPSRLGGVMVHVYFWWLGCNLHRRIRLLLRNPKGCLFPGQE